MNENTISKSDLWADRLLAFQESSLSRKEWCLLNEIPQSTLSYWIQKLQLDAAETACTFDPVFAKLSSKQAF